MTFRVGPTTCTHTIDPFLLTWPRRGGFRFAFKIVDMCGILGLNTYKGQASRRPSNFSAGWTQQCVDLGLHGQVLASQQSSELIGDVMEANCFLPAVGVTTFCLL